MAGISNDASLRGKVRAVAKKNGLRAQEVLQMYLFEHLLLRLAASPYSDRFVLKGGLLISFMIGLAQRTTMDMDATVVGMSMDRESVERAVTEVCSTAVGDGMEYAFERVEPIREDDECANWRVHIRVCYGRMDAPVKVDITTGDSIVPSQMEYPYPLMFEGGSVNVMSYPLATVLAEKFETVVRRGTANTRGRDFYDIYALMKVHGDDIDFVEVKAALNVTMAKRGSSSLMPEYHSVLESVRASGFAHLIRWYRSGIRIRSLHPTRLERPSTRSSMQSWSSATGRSGTASADPRPEAPASEFEAVPRHQCRNGIRLDWSSIGAPALSRASQAHGAPSLGAAVHGVQLLV